MNSAAHFVDAFWTEEFCSNAGYEVVVKRTKDGHSLCKTVIGYLRQRAKAEQDYAASLQKIVRSDFSLETGLMGKALEAVKHALSRVTEEHQGSGRQMIECADRLQSFTEKQKTERMKEEKSMSLITQKKQEFYKKCQHAKKAYHQAAMEAEKAEDDVAKAKPTMNAIATKDWERLINNAAKAKRDSEKADDMYKKSVRILEDTRHQWEKDLERFFVYCERQELDRIKILQNEIWTHANITSEACVEDDKSCEDIRLTLEVVDPSKDLQSFVQNNFIGSQKPAPVVYEPYVSTYQTSEPGNSASQSAIGSTLQARTVKTLLPRVHSPLPNRKNNRSDSSSSDCIDIEPYSTCTQKNFGKIQPSNKLSSASQQDISGSRTNLKEATKGYSNNSPMSSNFNGSMQNINTRLDGPPLYSPVLKPKPHDPVRTPSLEEAVPAYTNVTANSGGNAKGLFSATVPLKTPKPSTDAQTKKQGPTAIWKTKPPGTVASNTTKTTRI